MISTTFFDMERLEPNALGVEVSYNDSIDVLLNDTHVLLKDVGTIMVRFGALMSSSCTCM